MADNPNADADALDELDDEGQPVNEIGDDGKPVRRGPRKPTGLDERMGEALRAYRDNDVRLTRIELVAILNARHPDEPWQESRLARIEKGGMRLTLNDITNIIDALGAPASLIYRRAGFITLPRTVEEAILADPHLTAFERRSFAMNYGWAVERSRAEIGDN